jgi:PAS domain S-box-containing protein
MTLDFQALFTDAADGMYVVDASLTIVEVNDAFATMMGTKRAAMLGRRITGFIQREDLRLSPPQTEIVAREGSVITMRRFRRSDGSTVEGEVAATRLSEGRIFCVVRDLARRAVVSALRDSEARFRGVAENLNAGLVVTDLENRARLRERTDVRDDRLLARRAAGTRDQRAPAARVRAGEGCAADASPHGWHARAV